MMIQTTTLNGNKIAINTRQITYILKSDDEMLVNFPSATVYLNACKFDDIRDAMSSDD